MTNSDGPSWSEYLESKNALNIFFHPDNEWLLDFFINLSLRYPVTTFVHTIESVKRRTSWKRHRHLSKRDGLDRVRHTFHLLLHAGILREGPRTIWRPDMSKVNEPLYSFCLNRATQDGGEDGREDGRLVQLRSQSERTFYLASDAPSASILKEVKEGWEHEFPLSYWSTERSDAAEKFGKQYFDADPVYSHFPYWLGLAEVHLRKMKNGPSGNPDSFVALESRLAGYLRGLTVYPVAPELPSSHARFDRLRTLDERYSMISNLRHDDDDGFLVAYQMPQNPKPFEPRSDGLDEHELAGQRGCSAENVIWATSQAKEYWRSGAGVLEVW